MNDHNICIENYEHRGYWRDYDVTVVMIKGKIIFETENLTFNHNKDGDLLLKIETETILKKVFCVDHLNDTVMAIVPILIDLESTFWTNQNIIILSSCALIIIIIVICLICKFLSFKSHGEYIVDEKNSNKEQNDQKPNVNEQNEPKQDDQKPNANEQIELKAIHQGMQK